MSQKSTKARKRVDTAEKDPIRADKKTCKRIANTSERKDMAPADLATDRLLQHAWLRKRGSTFHI